MCVREGNCRLVWVPGIVVITKVFISTESWFLGNGLQYSWGQKRGKSRRQGAFKKATLFTRKTTIFGKLFLAFPLSHFFKCVSDSNYFDFVLERRCCYNFGFKWSSPGFRFLVARLLVPHSWGVTPHFWIQIASTHARTTHSNSMKPTLRVNRPHHRGL